MQERHIRQEISRVFKAAGMFPDHHRDGLVCPHCKRRVLPDQAGRPDIEVLNPRGKSVVIEVKHLDVSKSLSFSIDNISEQQVQWMDYWTNDLGGMGFLGLGVSGIRDRKLWLIEWRHWVVTTSEFPQRSIPYLAGKGMLREIQDGNLDLVNLFADYELERITGGWRIPPKHILGEIVCTN